MANKASEDIQKATLLLKTLLSTEVALKPPGESLPAGSVAMPVQHLAQCHGLLFTHIAKGGVGISFSYGSGFVIAKLSPSEGQPPQAVRWSAPLFLTASSAGFGASLGYSEVSSVVVLNSRQDVEQLAQGGKVEFSTVVGAAAGRAYGTHNEAHIAETIANDVQHFEYSLSNGVMVDVSLTGGGMSVDNSVNAALYGAEYKPAEVLSGKLSAPASMEPLYELLKNNLEIYYAYIAESS